MISQTFAETLERPGGEIEHRELTVSFMDDVSGSMTVEGKIVALNQAMKACLPDVKADARKHPHVRVYGQAITFGCGAEVIIHRTPIEQFEWHDVAAGASQTDMGAAFEKLAELFTATTQQRALRPLVILCSDGAPTDNWQVGLQKLLETELARKSVRVGIAIGQRADRKMLHSFMGGDPEFRPLEAENAEQLAKRIHWATTTFINHISESKTLGLPPMPKSDADSGDGIWK